MTTSQWKKPLPVPSELSRPFWEATRQGILKLQRCDDCGAFVWTPQPACRRCLGERLRWTPVSGRGTVYSFSVLHRPPTPAFQVPHVVAIVELTEGPRLMADLIEVRPEAVRIGMPVEVAFEIVGDVGLYHFRPRPLEAPPGSAWLQPGASPSG